MPIKFTSDKTTMLSLIQPTLSAVSGKNTLPALEGLLFSLKGNDLSVCGYDLEKGVKTFATVEGESDGEIILNAQKIFAVIRNFPDCDITFESDDKFLAKISGGMSEFMLHGLSGDAFPGLPMLGGDRAFSMSRSLLREVVQSTGFAVAQTDARPILTGQLFKIEKNKLTVVALDNYRLALRIEENAIKDNDEDFSLVIPGKTLSEFVKIMDDSDEDVNIEFTDKYIIFKLDGVILFSRLLEGEFLNYEKAIPKENKIFVKINTKDFTDCIERAALLVDEKLKTPLRCKFNGNILNVSCTTQYGSVDDNIRIEKEGDEIEIGFNHKYLSDALRAVKSKEINVSMSTPFFAMIISPYDEKPESKTVYLVLPVRLKD